MSPSQPSSQSSSDSSDDAAVMRARERNSLVMLLVLAGSVMWAWVNFAVHGSSGLQLIVMVTATILLFLFVLLTQHALRCDMRDVQRKVDAAVAELAIANQQLDHDPALKPRVASQLTIDVRRETADLCQRAR